MIKPYLFIEPAPSKGKGIFTRQKIAKNTLIEESPVIVMNANDRMLLDRTRLHDYIFEWGAQKDQCCMALGWVPLYNHSYASNCEYIMDFENDTIAVFTVRKIAAGEELTINYNGDWNNEKKIWFEAI